MSNDYTAFEPVQSRAADGVFRENVPLAMAYVRDQAWERTLSARDALKQGTAFPSLVMPFLGKEACGK